MERNPKIMMNGNESENNFDEMFSDGGKTTVQVSLEQTIKAAENTASTGTGRGIGVDPNNFSKDEFDEGIDITTEQDRLKELEGMSPEQYARNLDKKVLKKLDKMPSKYVGKIYDFLGESFGINMYEKSINTNLKNYEVNKKIYSDEIKKLESIVKGKVSFKIPENGVIPRIRDEDKGLKYKIEESNYELIRLGALAISGKNEADRINTQISELERQVSEFKKDLSKPENQVKVFNLNSAINEKNQYVSDINSKLHEYNKAIVKQSNKKKICNKLIQTANAGLSYCKPKLEETEMALDLLKEQMGGKMTYMDLVKLMKKVSTVSIDNKKLNEVVRVYDGGFDDIIESNLGVPSSESGAPIISEVSNTVKQVNTKSEMSYQSQAADALNEIGLKY